MGELGPTRPPQDEVIATPGGNNEDIKNPEGEERPAVIELSPEKEAENAKQQEIKEAKEAKEIEYMTFDRKEIVNLPVEKIVGNLSNVLQKMELESVLKRTSQNDLVKMESILSLANDGDVSYHEADPDNRKSAGYGVIGDLVLKRMKFEIECLQSEILSKFKEALQAQLDELKLDPENGYTVFDWENNIFVQDENCLLYTSDAADE